MGKASEGVPDSVAATFAAEVAGFDSAGATASSPRNVGIAWARDGHAFAKHHQA